MEGTMAEIRMFGGNFAPRNWAFCNGALLPISGNSALFSIIGTIYGGDGRTTFALPDLRGRTAKQRGTGPGLTSVNLGQRGGAEQTYLQVPNLPPHHHSASINVTLQPANKAIPKDNYIAVDSTGASTYSNVPPSSGDTLGSSSVTVNNTGSGIPVDHRDPYLGLNFIICLQGLYPSRS